MSIIQKQFIKEVLEDEGRRLKKNQGMAIRKLLQFRTGDLLKKREVTVTASDSAGILSFKHKNYQRFLDMRTRISKGGSVTLKNYPIHNKFVMGHYYSIEQRLRYDFTEETITTIKRGLSNSQIKWQSK